MKIIEQNMQSISEIRKEYTFVQTGARISDVGGGGDMTKAVYDPNSVAGDAFDMDNMAESSTAKVLTEVERTGPTQIEAETGASSVTKLWSALRVRQAIVSWAATAVSIFSGNLSGYTEESGPVIITAGAGAVNYATTENIRPITLIANTTVTYTNLVANKPITHPIAQNAGPWTFTIAYGAKTLAVTLNGATGEAFETVELWCDGTDIFVPTDGGVLWTVGV